MGVGGRGSPPLSCGQDARHTENAGGDRRRPLDERCRYTMRRASARRFLIPFSSPSARVTMNSRSSKSSRVLAHEEEDRGPVNLAADRLVLNPVGRAQAVPSAFALLLGSAFAFALGLGDALHLGGDHPLHLLWRGEALVWVPVLVHLLFLSVACATPHMMPQRNGKGNRAVRDANACRPPRYTRRRASSSA